MGASQSSSPPSSSLEEGTASIISPTSAGGAGGGAGVRLSASMNSVNRDGLANDIDVDTDIVSRQHATYEPPSSPVHPLAHYIFLVHGWLGNDLEMSYLEKAFANSIHMNDNDDDESDGMPLAKRVRRSPSQLAALANAKEAAETVMARAIIVHSVKCNVGKTHDGIKNGGRRLANEIVDFIQSDVQKRASQHDNTDNDTEESKDDNAEEKHVTYSIVGNSLGGLYARYAISLLPIQLQIPRNIQSSASISEEDATNNKTKINLHPNIFCTTATPHLGVSRHTYLPIPRFAETIIGSGMGKTGKDLFRLNSDKNTVAAATNVAATTTEVVVGVAGGLMKRLSSTKDINANGETDYSENEEDMECIIRNMCLQDKYLKPLSNFRERIAYANAYRTDFQVPTETAAFLNVESDVSHKVIASRDFNKPVKDVGGEEAEKEGTERERNIAIEKDGNVSYDAVPPFVVAVVRTEHQLPQEDAASVSNELLNMSQTLDALGWTKVFIDVRKSIPLPGIPKPSWILPPPNSSLDHLIQERSGAVTGSASNDTTEQSADATATAKSAHGECVVTSRELAQSTSVGDSLHFPLGHTVMVANSKSERYSKLNSQGRPVMDKLAEDMVRDVLLFG